MPARRAAMPDATTAAVFVRTREAAVIIGCSYRSLITWRCRGGGPAYRRIGPGGRAVVYALADLRAWVETRPTQLSTHEVVA